MDLLVLACLVATFATTSYMLQNFIILLKPGVYCIRFSVAATELAHAWVQVWVARGKAQEMASAELSERTMRKVHAWHASAMLQMT